MEKIIVVVMGQNCERTIDMVLESVKDADAIVYCDGGSEDNTLSYLMDQGMIFIKEKDGFLKEITHAKPVKIPLMSYIIQHKYDQEDKAMNGKQRNFYLKYVKENYPDYWCIALDADEVIEDFSKIREFIEEAKSGIWSVKMRHLIGDLGHEDAIQPEHYVLNRLFKISDTEGYPEVEHPVLQPKEGSVVGATKCTTIWHLAYVPNSWEIKKRYENHLKKSNIHSPEYLRRWYFDHLFGTYPKKQINPLELPEIILNKFGIEKDELYFINRGVEIKHFILLRQWANYAYSLTRPTDRMKIAEIGCGLGNYGFVAEGFLNMKYKGFEKSKYAVRMNPHKLNLQEFDLTKQSTNEEFDLVLVIDVLEHIDYKELDKAIDNIPNGTVYIFSIPFKGDPNLEADITHKIKESKLWWEEKLKDHGFNIKDPPENFLFRHQILTGLK